MSVGKYTYTSCELRRNYSPWSLITNTLSLSCFTRSWSHIKLPPPRVSLIVCALESSLAFCHNESPTVLFSSTYVLR